MDNVRPYVILGDGDRARLADRVRSALGQWADDWIAKGMDAPALVPVDSASATFWIKAESAPLYAVSVGCSQAWFDQAPNLIGGTRPAPHTVERAASSGLVGVVCRAALEALALLLCGDGSHTQRTDAIPIDAMTSPGSGFVEFACQFGNTDAQIHFVGWPAWVVEARKSTTDSNRVKPPLVPIVDTLGRESVVVRAIVGDAQLPLGDLAGLAVGDVLVVDRRLGAPLDVRVDGAETFAAGHLCASGGRRAVELTTKDA